MEVEEQEENKEVVAVVVPANQARQSGGLTSRRLSRPLVQGLVLVSDSAD